MLTSRRRTRLSAALFLRDDTAPLRSFACRPSLGARNHGSARWIGRTQLLGPRSTECSHPSSLHNEGPPMRNRLIALSTAAAVIAAAACGSDSSTPPVSHVVNFNVNMTPGNEVGANITSSGTGVFKATLDTVTNVFTWNFTFQGLTSNVKLGHIHGPYVLGSGNNASVILDFNPAATTPATNVKFDGLNSAATGSGSGTIVLAGSTVIGN